MVVSTAINLEEQTGSTKDLIEEENETKYGLWVNIKEFFRRSKDKIHDSECDLIWSTNSTPFYYIFNSLSY